MIAHPAQFDDHGPGLKPPRFSMRVLLLAMAVASTGIGLLATMDVAMATAFVLLVLLIAAHVLGNRLGTELRRSSRQQFAGEEPPAPFKARSDRWQPPPRSQMQQHRSFGIWTLIPAALGALLGAAGGARLLAADLEKVSLTAILLGGVAAGVLGAMFVFAAANLLGILFKTWREAVRYHRQQP